MTSYKSWAGLPIWPYYGQTPQIWPFWKVSGRKIFKEKVWPYFGLFSMQLANFYNVWPFPSFLAFFKEKSSLINNFRILFELFLDFSMCVWRWILVPVFVERFYMSKHFWAKTSKIPAKIALIEFLPISLIV